MQALVLAVLLASGAQHDLLKDLLALPAPPPGEYGTVEAPVLGAEAPPPEAAPLDLLVKWWSMNRFADEIEPPASVRERLVDAIEKQPESVDDLLDYFPRREDVCRRLGSLRSPSDRIETWRRHHCGDERDALVEAAAAATVDGSYVAGAEDLVALARADWSRAEPIVKQFAGSSEPRLRALALAIQYEHAPNDEHRVALQSLAADVTAPGSARDLAFDALAAVPWAGRDEWFLSQLSDPSLLQLRDGYTMYAPIDSLAASDPDRWIPVMTQLLGSADRTTRSLAANALAQFHLRRSRADALRAVVPWISDPAFADDRSMHRLRIIQSVAGAGLAEAIPHLLVVLANDPNDANRAYAAEALSKFREPRANPGMREALEAMKRRGSNRSIVIAALVANGGCSPDELANGVETFVRHRAALPPGEAMMLGYDLGGESVALSVLLGSHVVTQTTGREDVATLLLARADELESKEPEIARALREIVSAWPVPASDAFLLRRMEAGTADAAMILAALNRREALRETSGDALRRLSGTPGARSGIGAVLLGDARLETQLLASDDVEAQRALLAASRLVREPLPVAAIAALFGRSPSLDAAAEAWLIAEDGADAREIVQSRHPNEILILGWGGFEEWEKPILRGFQRSRDDELIALAAGGFTAPASVLEIRIRGNQATLSSERRSTRLAPAVLAELRAFLSELRADDLGPIETGTADGTHYEYLHLARVMTAPHVRGRRVWMNSPYNESGSPHAELVRRLLALVE